MSDGLTIDWETADRITTINLQNARKYLLQELKENKENGAWLHPEDVIFSEDVLIPALETIIKYYGGEVE